VNQFSAMGGVAKAAELGALSVDHLEELTDQDVQALKNTSCMPVFLPGCSHFLSIPYGNARLLMENDIPVALASDFNPGSSPNYNLFTIWSLACVKMKMTPEEAFNALTVNAACAMELGETHGKIFLGYRGGIVLTNEIPTFSYMPYSFGESHVQRILNL
jgi:imidazolonepropionase